MDDLKKEVPIVSKRFLFFSKNSCVVVTDFLLWRVLEVTKFHCTLFPSWWSQLSLLSGPIQRSGHGQSFGSVHFCSCQSKDDWLLVYSFLSISIFLKYCENNFFQHPWNDAKMYFWRKSSFRMELMEGNWQHVFGQRRNYFPIHA